MLKGKLIGNNSWKKSITIDKFVLSIFFLINVGLYYDEFLFLIKLTYALLFLAFVYKISVEKKIIHRGYIFITLTFAVFAFLSALWANDTTLAIENSFKLIKYVLISIMIITLLDKKENVIFALWILAISGLVYTLYYLSFWDVTQLGASRADNALSETKETLPNLNLVGLIVANSFIILLFYYFRNKNKLALILSIIAFVSVFLLGSRKSIIFVVMGLIMIILKLKGTSKVSLISLIASLVALLILFIPPDYFSFIWDRFGELNFLNKVNNLAESDRLRVDFIKQSFNYFNNNPLIGNGYYNFSSLYYKERGMAMYSHNNFIETLVGLGVVGLFLYYQLYYVLFKRTGGFKSEGMANLFFILLLLNIINHFFIVVTNDRFTWMLLPILYAGSNYFNSRKKLSS